MDQVYIQIQDTGGNWITIILAGYRQEEEVIQLLEMAQASRPGKNLRAVTRQWGSPKRSLGRITPTPNGVKDFSSSISPG